MPKKEKTPTQKKEEKKSFQTELMGQLISLSTAGFGLVAALAWNEAIQGFVKEYIQRYFPQSAIWSKFLYALIITSIAVLITYQLSKIAARVQDKSK